MFVSFLNVFWAYSFFPLFIWFFQQIKFLIFLLLTPKQKVNVTIVLTKQCTQTHITWFITYIVNCSLLKITQEIRHGSWRRKFLFAIYSILTKFFFLSLPFLPFQLSLFHKYRPKQKNVIRKLHFFFIMFYAHFRFFSCSFPTLHYFSETTTIIFFNIC